MWKLFLGAFLLSLCGCSNQSPNETWIGIMVSIMGICAVFVTITPIVNTQRERVLARQLNSIKLKAVEEKKELEKTYFKRENQIYKEFSTIFDHFAKIQNTLIDYILYKVVALSINNHKVTQDKEKDCNITSFRTELNDRIRNGEKVDIDACYQKIEIIYHYISEIKNDENLKKRLTDILSPIIGEDPTMATLKAMSQKYHMAIGHTQNGHTNSIDNSLINTTQL